MATAAQFLAIARKYVGTSEFPAGSNVNPFSQRLGRPAEAWCADFIVAVAREAGVALPSESAYTPTMADAFRRAGRFVHAPKQGDIGFVDFPGDNHTGIQHAWIVDEVHAPNELTVEGNTSSGITGSQDNGGVCAARLRPMAWVVGYGRPAFDEPLLMAPHAAQIPDEEAEMGCVIDRPQGGYIVVDHAGAVFAYGSPPAPYLGGANQHPEWKLGGNIVGGAWTESGNGYWLVAHDGAVFSFGDAEYHGGFNALSPDVRGTRFAVGLATAAPGCYEVVTYDPSNDGSPYDQYEFCGHA